MKAGNIHGARKAGGHRDAQRHRAGQNDKADDVLALVRNGTRGQNVLQFPEGDDAGRGGQVAQQRLRRRARPW